MSKSEGRFRLLVREFLSLLSGAVVQRLRQLPNRISTKGRRGAFLAFIFGLTSIFYNSLPLFIPTTWYPASVVLHVAIIGVCWFIISFPLAFLFQLQRKTSFSLFIAAASIARMLVYWGSTSLLKHLFAPDLVAFPDSTLNLVPNTISAVVSSLAFGAFLGFMIKLNLPAGSQSHRVVVIAALSLCTGAIISNVRFLFPLQFYMTVDEIIYMAISVVIVGVGTSLAGLLLGLTLPGATPTIEPGHQRA